MFNKPLIVHTLDNGLNVVILRQQRVPEVSCQLWYKVGSVHERDGQRGIAHFIEHMIFKGTENLSETDIDSMIHSFSGSMNAFTSHDFTGYLFDLPTRYWQECLPIMADCMQNCVFDRQHMASEVKAVVQELKMYADDYLTTLIERIMGYIFYDHPYRYPIIGYKSDLLSLSRESLLQFYQEHYIPSNGNLIIVGDVDPDKAIIEVEKSFASIAKKAAPALKTVWHEPDVATAQLTLYRDIQQPSYLFAWEIPGVKGKIDKEVDILTWILGAGKGSLLYQELVHKQDIAQDVSCFVYDLFDYSVLFIHVVLFDQADYVKMQDTVHAILEQLASGNLHDTDIQRGLTKAQSEIADILLDNQKTAYTIGKYSTALNDPLYLQAYISYKPDTAYRDWISQFVTRFLRESVCIQGAILPLQKTEIPLWQSFQYENAERDMHVMDSIVRTELVTKSSKMHSFEIHALGSVQIPKYFQIRLQNGLSILWVDDKNYGKTAAFLDFKRKYYDDPVDKQGMLSILYEMLPEGTKNDTAASFAVKTEALGIDITTFAGMAAAVSLNEQNEAMLQFLHDIVCGPSLQKSSMQKVVDRTLIDIKDYWDNPSQYAAQLLKEIIYEGHPYSNYILGNPATIAQISYEDIVQCYKTAIVGPGSRLVLVGDMNNARSQSLISRAESLFSLLPGKQPHLGLNSVISPLIAPRTIIRRVNREQVVLLFGGLGVSRLDPDYDALLLFDQIFTGGVLGSMNSRLFMIRQQTGICYTIGGSLVASADEQPGFWYIQTIVSPDKIDAARQVIGYEIDNAIESLTQRELDEACNAILHSLTKHVSTPRSLAAAILFIDRCGLDNDYFANRAKLLRSWKIADVQAVVRRYINTAVMATVIVGPVE